MDWVRRMLEGWRAGQGRVRRVIVLGFAGLEPALVDHYLEQGLLHNLALLSDVGTRAARADFQPLDADFFAAAIGNFGVRAIALPPPHESAPADLQAICADDSAQQERMIAALTRSRRGVVVCVFDMPARLQALFGPEPAADQRQVMRDVYARMDEVVGKAFSFVDERTVLLVLIPATSVGPSAAASAAAGLLFSSRKLDAHSTEAAFQTVALGLLGVTPRKS